ncbi:hypothetical protein ACFYZ6_34890 [Streptomyces rubiginosohelvolus]|nr:hypothetical protein [Streptomyces californicus]MDW4917717.1 hypothetical protein [Streptomyces californicus]
MTAIAVEIATPSRPSDEEEFEVVEDMDKVASTEIMLGCGEDNPFG